MDNSKQVVSIKTSYGTRFYNKDGYYIGRSK